MKKLDPYESYTETKIKRLQVVYLSYVKKLPPREIKKYVDYAISTIATYSRKFLNNLAEAKNLFDRIEDYIVTKVKDLGKPGSEKCYLFKFYDFDKQILFSKVGTTTREVLTRAKEEFRNYSKQFNIGLVTIESVIDCGAVPAEGAESFCRAKFIKMFPNAFKKNDRFLNVDISTKDFNSIVSSYLVQRQVFCPGAR